MFEETFITTCNVTIRKDALTQILYLVSGVILSIACGHPGKVIFYEHYLERCR